MVGAAQPRIPFLWILLFLLSLLLLLPLSSSADFSHCGGCDDGGDGSLWSTENILQCQKASDFLIATAYFSIPLELLYFATCSDLFPLKWIVLQFGAFIVLCGLTHLINVFTYGPHSFHVVLALTVGKFLTALVSFATAITLLTLIPQLLRVKVREDLLATIPIVTVGWTMGSFSWAWAYRKPPKAAATYTKNGLTDRRLGLGRLRPPRFCLL